MIPTLQTARLILRPPAESDLDPLIALGADPDVRRFISHGHIQSPAEAEGWLGGMLRDGREGIPGPAGLPGWLVAEVKADGSWAGLAVLKTLSPRHSETLGCGPVVEVGYRLARSHWAKGYATEAAKALVSYGFEILGLPEVVAIAHAHNGASNRVIEKIGMRYQKRYSVDGIPIHFHSIDRETYLSTRRPPE